MLRDIWWGSALSDHWLLQDANPLPLYLVEISVGQNMVVKMLLLVDRE